jgi:hypothetical protein
MDSSSDDQIARLLRLKRYEQPPPGYFENFLHEFRQRRKRDELVRPRWRMWFECVRNFALRPDVRPWVTATATAVVACAAVISNTTKQYPDTTQAAVQNSPVPSTPTATQQQFDFPPPAFTPSLDMQPAAGSGDVWTVACRFIPLRSICPTQPRMGIARRSAGAGAIETR